MITSLLLTFRLLEYHNITFNIIYAMKITDIFFHKIYIVNYTEYKIQNTNEHQKIMKAYSNGSSSLTPCPCMALSPKL